MTIFFALLAIKPGFQISATLPKTSYVEGEALGLTIALRNVGDAEIVTIDPTDDPDGHVLQWRLVRSDGSLTWREGHKLATHCCAAARAPRYASIPAGETLRWTETVVRDDSLPEALRTIPPGRYRIELAFRYDPGIYMPPATRRRVDWSLTATASTPWFIVRSMSAGRRATWDRYQELIDSNRPITEQMTALRALGGPPDLRYRIGRRIASLYARRGEYAQAYRQLVSLRGLPTGGDDLDWRLGEAAYRADMVAEARQAFVRSPLPRARRMLSGLPGPARP